MFRAMGNFKKKLTRIKKVYILLLLLLAIPCLVQAEEGDVIWWNDYEYTSNDANSLASAIKELDDGGYVFCGYLIYDEESETHHELFIVKISVDGDTVWTKNYYYGPDDGPTAYDIVVTADGGYAICGTMRHYNGYATEGFFMRTDANGDSLYTHIFSGSGSYENVILNSMLCTADGGFFIVGYDWPYWPYTYQGLHIKIDSEGSVKWVNTIFDEGQEDAIEYVFNDAVETADNDFILTGQRNYISSQYLDSTHALITKVDSSGAEVWSVSYGIDNYISSMIQLDNGNIVCAGVKDDSSGACRCWLAEIDVQDEVELLWENIYTYDLHDGDVGKSICKSDDGGYVVGGYGVYSDEYSHAAYGPVLFKIQSDGTQEWIYSYSDAASRGNIYDLILTSDGYYLTAGRTDYVRNPDGYLIAVPDPMVMKIQGPLVSVEHDEQIDLPLNVSLLENYPNPFNATTTIQFYIKYSSDVTLSVYDMLGRKVNTLHSGFLNAGIHSITWSGTAESGEQVSSGVYFYRLETAEESISNRMLLLK